MSATAKMRISPREALSTEKHLRDIAQTVENLPNGAEPASNLTKAAQKMERAIVGLRDKDLAGAYEPPQVEALAALLDAKKIIDEQKQKVDAKRDEQQKGDRSHHQAMKWRRLPVGVFGVQ